jgi:hypothetical protein
MQRIKLEIFTSYVNRKYGLYNSLISLAEWIGKYENP